MDQKKMIAMTIVSAFFATSVSAETPIDACKNFTKEFPKTTAQEIIEAPIPGLCEIHSGVNVYYYSPSSSHLIVGSVYTPNGEDLTGKAKDVLTKKVFDSLPLDLAIKSGKGPVTVIEWTDPDCPYCRTLRKAMHSDATLAQKATLYTFMFPLDKLHERAADKARWIFCQKDQVAAMNSVMLDDHLAGDAPYNYPETCKISDVEKRLYENRESGKRMAVSGTPTVYVNGKKVQGPPEQVIAEINAAAGAPQGASAKAK